MMSILPAQIEMNVSKFIEEDKDGKQGKKWRISGRQFQKDLSLYLYKRIRNMFEVNVFQH